MIEYFACVIMWCFSIYGIINVINDVVKAGRYKKIEENVKLIMTVKNVEAGIENYIREISLGRNFFNNLVIIDMDSEDNTMVILKELQEENINMKILDKKSGKEYLEEMIK